MGPLGGKSNLEDSAMSTTPIESECSSRPKESLEEQFQRLAEVWRKDMAYVSSTSEQVSHPAFQEIIGLGNAIIPLLLRELQQQTGPWHRALRRITGVDPVAAEDRGNLDRLSEAWLRWGREQGYQW
jgi:hypothetical protein